MAQLRNEFLNNNEDQQHPCECPISHEIMMQPVITDCGHTFEEKNIKAWIEKGNTHCPLCPAEVSIQKLHKDFLMKSLPDFIKTLEDKLNQAQKQLEALSQDNATLKTKMQTLQEQENKMIGHNNANPLEKALQREVKLANSINVSTSAQRDLVAARKKLMLETTPIIHKKLKELAFIHKRVNELESKFSGLDSKEPDMSPVLEIEKDIQERREKYQTFYKQTANTVRTQIIEPYSTKLEKLNQEIEQTTVQLSQAKDRQTKSLEKAAIKSRLMSTVTLKLFGGKQKFKSIQIESKDKPKVVVETPIEKKPIVQEQSMVELTKQTEALRNAIYNKDHAAALVALQKGANPDACITKGPPFIIGALQRDDDDMIRILLEYKANPNIKCKDGYTVLSNCAVEKEVSSKKLAIAALLLDNKADPNVLVGSWGYTALHFAAERGNIELVCMLLNRHADPTIKNGYSQTPAHIASHEGIRDALANATRKLAIR